MNQTRKEWLKGMAVVELEYHTLSRVTLPDYYTDAALHLQTMGEFISELEVAVEYSAYNPAKHDGQLCARFRAHLQTARDALDKSDDTFGAMRELMADHRGTYPFLRQAILSALGPGLAYIQKLLAEYNRLLGAITPQPPALLPPKNMEATAIEQTLDPKNVEAAAT